MTHDFSSFLTQAGWGDADITPMSADAGLRAYYKLQKSDGSHVLLMDMSRSGYEASLDAFVSIGRSLKENNIHVPAVHHVSLDQGFAVIEDFGQKSFGDALSNGIDQKDIYWRATDVLIRLRQNLKQNDLCLGTYEESRIRERLNQFVDYYVPFASGVTVNDVLHQEFQGVMDEIESSLSKPVMGFCHADYHLENLMWCPDHDEGYGLIDFQDAFWGPLAYDLLNLLEDARVSVPNDIKAEMKALYCKDMTAEERKAFDAWYVLLSCHFHCRVIGLFVKLKQERGKDEYLVHIPRLQNYIKAHLKNPIMHPLKEFIDKHKVDLDKKIEL